MSRNLFGLLIILILAISCNEDVKSKTTKSTDPIHKEDSPKKVFSDGDYNFQVEYNSQHDTSYLDVIFKGKKISRHGFNGKLEKELIADLNKDSTNELYLIIKQKERSSIVGYVFEESIPKKIRKEEFRNLSKINSSTYKIINDQLVEQFKAPSTGGKMVFKEWRYNLVEKDDDFVLLPQGWKPHELSQMTGQYAARGDEKTGSYNVMLLNKKNGGNWNVSIKTKKKSDKEVLCDFNGDGYFVDKNLIVPLNKVNSKLKGSLKIQFVDLMAIVYTIDQENSNEMTTFCSGNGSIAGNFLKTNI